MKLIATELGRVTVIFSADEIRPISPTPVTEYLIGIAKRYGFPTVPEAPDADDPKPVTFQRGFFAQGEKYINVSRLAIYNDAIQVDTSRTDESLGIQQDILKYLQDNYSFREPSSKPMVLFESSVIVDFDHSINNALAKYEKLQKAASIAMSTTYGRDLQMQFSGLALAVDHLDLPSAIGSLLRSEFSIVRRINRPFAENRYFSSAGLQTATHLELLAQFEKLILDAN